MTRYWVLHFCGLVPADEAVINRMIGTVVKMLDAYMTAFLSVVYGNEDHEDAIRPVEAEFGQG
ncbi:MAG: hypothetical protein KJ000_14825 [Pirellulaceae bacterium]|nr:hypothetical protein [Pirellulaceae bacterium]